jgi:hypothetical protein
MTYKCDVCKKEIDGRNICGFLDGHVCLECGNSVEANVKAGLIFALVIGIIIFVSMFILLGK